jgi:hypothetical protein
LLLQGSPRVSTLALALTTALALATAAATATATATATDLAAATANATKVEGNVWVTGQRLAAGGGGGGRLVAADLLVFIRMLIFLNGRFWLCDKKNRAHPKLNKSTCPLWVHGMTTSLLEF